jgi:orotate phosphoribosyltransferase
MQKNINQKDFVLFLEKNGCIKIAANKNEFFLLKSGRLCPIFINIGRLIDGKSLDYLADAYADKIKKLLQNKEIEKIDVIYGPAYKGISLAALTAAKLYQKYKINTIFVYDRKEQKEYGDKNADNIIVGQDQIKDGQNVLLVDDVITSGKAKIQAYEKLLKIAKINLVGILVAIDREEVGSEKRESAKKEIEKTLGCKVYSLANMRIIYSTIKNKISKQSREFIKQYFQEWGEEELKQMLKNEE